MADLRPGFSRRAMMKSALAVGVAASWPALADEGGWQDHVVGYLQSLAGAHGGYGWGEGERSHLTPTHAVVGAYAAIGKFPPDKARLAEFIRTHHPMQLKKLEQEHREF